MRLFHRRPAPRSLLEEAQATVAQIDRLSQALVRWNAVRLVRAESSYEPLDAEAELLELAAVLAVLDRTERGHRPAGAKQRLGLVVDALAQLLGARLPVERDVPLDGIGVLRRSMSARRYAWSDGRRLAHIIAARAADERGFSREDGAQVPPGVLAGAVADELIACAGLDNRSGSWRSGELRSRHIDPADHREVTSEGRLGVRWQD